MRWDGPWVVSFADLMTMLLCLFTVVLAASPPLAAHAAKAKSVAASLRAAFGAGRRGQTPESSPPATLLEALTALSERESDAVGDGTPPPIRLSHDDEGIRITIAAGAVGTSDGVLRRIAARLIPLDAWVEVRAWEDGRQTSDSVAEPTRGERATASLESAFVRAKTVATVLSQCGLSIDRLQIGGNPGGTSTPAGSGVNDLRRVEIIVRTREESSLATPTMRFVKPQGPKTGNRRSDERPASR